MYGGVGLARAVLELLKGQAILHCKALIDATHYLAHAPGNGLACLTAEFPYPARDIAVRDEFGGVGVDEALERLRGEGELLKVGVGIIAAVSVPMAAALLNEPQPDYILEEADAAAVAALVGDVHGERLLVDYRGFKLRAEERPCAAREEGEVAALARDSGYRALSIVAADADNLGGGHSALVADILAQRAEHRAGGLDVAQQA